MKKRRICASVLAVSMVGAMLLNGCSGTGGSKDPEGSKQETTSSPASQTNQADQTGQENQTTQAAQTQSNPSEGKTLYVMVGNTEEDFLEFTSVKNLEAKYGGTIEWMQVTSEQREMMMNTGDYGDMLLGQSAGLNDSSVSSYVESGILIPLDDYINEELTPNLCKVFQDYPSAKAVSTFVDGHIYTLPRYSEEQAGYLEDVLFINKAWLDKLNLEVPTTIDELYEVLKAFKTGDPNGNGKADEIPMMFGTGNSGYSFVEELLCLWGLCTKPLTADAFRAVRDGEVLFAPATDEYKELLLYIRKLYQEGLIEPDVFVNENDNAYNAVCGSDPAIVGFTWNVSKAMSHPGDYIAIDPIQVPGYEIKWRMHPGSVGIKNIVAITDHCEDVEGAMRWLDTFYTEEATLENWYGPVGETFEIRDGMYYLIDESLRDGWTGENTVGGEGMPGIFRSSEVGTLLEPLDFILEKRVYYDQYKPYLAGPDEIWPRPYLSPEQTTVINEVYPDLRSYVLEKKAHFVTDPTADIEAEWDGYVNDLKNLRLDDFLEASQEAYDAFYNTYVEMLGN